MSAARVAITAAAAVFSLSIAARGEDRRPFTTVSFPSEDGLQVTADLYRSHAQPDAPMIVLFHQAGWSRGEYREIAPRLNALGFNCLAVDARSGKSVNGVVNQTAARAEKAGKATGFVDALPDLRAALRFARSETKGKLIAWGSSYSAALVLLLGGQSPELADAWVAFSPGEYFKRFGKPATWIGDAAAKLSEPVFVTSAKKEQGSWQPIYQRIRSKAKIAYVPATAGNHGSRALWRQFDDSAGYWNAITTFLQQHRH